MSPRRADALLLAAMVMIGLLAGCAARVTAPYAPLSLSPTQDRFSAGLGLVTSSTSLEPEDSWRDGDAVVFGVAVDGPGGSDEWYVRITLRPHPAGATSRRPYRLARRHPQTGEIESRDLEFGRISVFVEVYDAAARPVAASSTELADVCARYGLYDWVVARGEDPPLDADPEDLARVAAGWLFLTRMPRTLEGHEASQQAMKSILDRPSILSLLFTREFSMELDPIPEAGGPTVFASPAGGTAVPAYRLPMELRGGGKVMMRCEVVVARVVPPLGACSGVVSADAWNPRDPRKRVAVRLLGVSRAEH